MRARRWLPIVGVLLLSGSTAATADCGEEFVGSFRASGGAGGDVTVDGVLSRCARGGACSRHEDLRPQAVTSAVLVVRGSNADTCSVTLATSQGRFAARVELPPGLAPVEVEFQEIGGGVLLRRAPDETERPSSPVEIVEAVRCRP